MDECSKPCLEDCPADNCVFADVPDNPPDEPETAWPDQVDEDDPNLTGTELPDDFPEPDLDDLEDDGSEVE